MGHSSRERLEIIEELQFDIKQGQNVYRSEVIANKVILRQIDIQKDGQTKIMTNRQTNLQTENRMNCRIPIIDCG